MFSFIGFKIFTCPVGSVSGRTDGPKGRCHFTQMASIYVQLCDLLNRVKKSLAAEARLVELNKQPDRVRDRGKS